MLNLFEILLIINGRVVLHTSATELQTKTLRAFKMLCNLVRLSNWRLRWKKGARIFTQNWTLSKTLQISHAVSFRCVKQCSVCFFAEVFFIYEILRMQKSLYLWSHQHVTGKTVISLKIQQNIDLLQHVTLKSVDFRVTPLQFWFHVNVRPQRR